MDIHTHTKSHTQKQDTEGPCASAKVRGSECFRDRKNNIKCSKVGRTAT